MVTLPNIGLFDICLGVVYLFIIYFFALRYKQKQVKTNPEYRYFLIGLIAKSIGSIAFVIISLYYYKEGDTFLYFQIAEDVRNHMSVNLTETLNTIFTPYSELSTANFNPLEKYNYYYERTSNWTFGRIVFIFNVLSFGSYLVSSILMSVVSFLGLWLGYKSISKMYPSASKLILIPFFLIPTATIWSSGLLKDTLIMGILGMLLYGFSNIFILKKRLLLNILYVLFGFLVIQLLKPIFLIVFVPCLLIWLLPIVTKSIVNWVLRILAKVSIFIIILGLGYFVNNKLLEPTSKYRIDNLFETLEGFQSFHSMEVFSKGQSVYTLGGMATTPLEVIKKTPEAINVTLFRPYLWEVTNFPLLLGAIESLLLLLVFLYILYNLKIQFFKTMIKNNDARFMMTFAIFYSIVVGISSYNFGALSRYKIPAILFFILSLVIIYKTSGKQIKPNFVTKFMTKILNLF